MASSSKTNSTTTSSTKDTKTTKKDTTSTKKDTKTTKKKTYKADVVLAQGNTVKDLVNMKALGIPTDGAKTTSTTKGSKAAKEKVNIFNLKEASRTKTMLGPNEYVKINNNKYPKIINKKKDTDDSNLNYDYSIPTNIRNAISNVKIQMGVPSAYNINTINNYVSTYFNRYRMEFPDLYLKNTKGVIIFTRPDLNIYTSSGAINKQFKCNERCYGILKRNPVLGKMLTRNSNTTSSLNKHNLSPLLSNLAQGLEVQDDSVDVIETGETFNGYKMQYAKHNIKSITSGQLSIRYKETHNLAVTCLHQLWIDYISNVYLGVMSPTDNHIWNRELDYACNAYYFLLAEDGETILFWTKYYGCFPVNVPKSSFSFEYGSEISLPDVSVTYNYIYKSDLSNRALIEFNNDGGNKGTGYTYLSNYNENHVMSAPWAGIPFIDKEFYDNGVTKKSIRYKLRYRSRIT